MFTHIHTVAVPFFKRGVLDSEVMPALERNLKVAATWKTTAMDVPPHLGEVPEEI